MRLFDNKVQEIKYKVLREVAYQAWHGNEAFAEFNTIANNVIPKDQRLRGAAFTRTELL